MNLTLHLTESCNMRCGYCYAARPGVGEIMSRQTGARALEFGGGSTDGSCGISLFGGEPLLERGLIMWLLAEADRLERRGIGRYHFKLTTNGLLLDEEMLNLAQRHSIAIAFSFDGVRDAHDRHRHLADGRPTFELLLPRLRLLLSVRPYSRVLMTVNPDTVEHYADSVRFIVDEGVRYLIVSLNYAAPWTTRDLANLEAQYELVAEQYLRWSREGRSFYLSPFEVMIASHVSSVGSSHHCQLGQKQISVDPAGYLYPCVQFAAAGPDSRWCIGHVSSGIDEAARERLYLESTGQREPCRNCAIRDRCNHTCGCVNWQVTGNVSEVAPVLCQTEQMLLPIADGVAEKLYRESNSAFLDKHYNPAYPLLSLLQDTV